MTTVNGLPIFAVERGGATRKGVRFIERNGREVCLAPRTENDWRKRYYFGRTVGAANWSWFPSKQDAKNFLATGIACAYC